MDFMCVESSFTSMMVSLLGLKWAHSLMKRIYFIYSLIFKYISNYFMRKQYTGSVWERKRDIQEYVDDDDDHSQLIYSLHR